MAASKTTAADKKSAVNSLEPIAEALGKAAGQLWKMFVMRYVAKGLSEIFIALFIIWTSNYFLLPTQKIWHIPFFLVAGVFVYDAIQLLVDPHYFAMNDVAMRLKSEGFFKK